MGPDNEISGLKSQRTAGSKLEPFHQPSRQGTGHAPRHGRASASHRSACCNISCSCSGDRGDGGHLHQGVAATCCADLWGKQSADKPQRMHEHNVLEITLATMRVTSGNGWSCRGREEHVEHPHGHAPPTTHHRTGPARRLMSTMTFDVITQQPLGVVCADFSMCQW